MSYADDVAWVAKAIHENTTATAVDAEEVAKHIVYALTAGGRVSSRPRLIRAYLAGLWCGATGDPTYIRRLADRWR